MRSGARILPIPLAPFSACPDSRASRHASSSFSTKTAPRNSALKSPSSWSSVHCVDTGHDTWGDQGDKEEEEIEADEVHNLEGYQVKFLKLLEIFFNICLRRVFMIYAKGW